MRIPVYFLCAALLTAARANSEETETAAGGYYSPRARAEDSGLADDTLRYLLPRLTAKYRPSGQWNALSDPEYFLDASGLNDQEPEDRFKRAGTGASLSIVNPIDVLRKNFLMEMARRRAHEMQKQVEENRKYMNAIGKRGSFLRQPEAHRASPVGYDTM